MASDDDTHLLGNPDDLRKILEALEDRNEALDSHSRGVEKLALLVAANTAQVRALRDDVLARPTEAAVNYRRRLTAVTMMLVGLVALGLQDSHVEHCSPGTRVTHAFDHLLTHPLGPKATPEQRTADFEAYYNTAPAWCDVSYPLHTHDGEPWPSQANVVGAAGYLAFGLLMTAWLLVARRRAYKEAPNERPRADHD